MKNILLTLFTISTVLTLKSQVSMFVESGVSSLGSNNHIGIEYVQRDKRVGFYATVGGNWMDKFIGSNTSLVLDCEGDFTSTVPWYTKDGCHYKTLPPNKMFTSPEWGNRLLEVGTCVNTVETWSGELTTSVQTYNVGVVIKDGKNENLQYRIGGVVTHIYQEGYCDYRYWQHTYYVSKYYDEWGVIAQPNGIFVVATSGNVNEWEETKYSTFNTTKFNLNLAVEYKLINGTLVSFGVNTKGGFNFGVGFPLSKHY
jgi:hypothetical protein